MALPLDELIKNHWRYTGDVLQFNGVPDEQISAMKFHYISAFRHRYKHAKEDWETHAEFRS